MQPRACARSRRVYRPSRCARRAPPRLACHDVRYLHRGRLTRQRKHLVHRDPRPDRRIAQAGLANRFLHATGSKFSDVSQHRGETLFSLGYVLSFTGSDGAHGMTGDAVKLGRFDSRWQ